MKELQGLTDLINASFAMMALDLSDFRPNPSEFVKWNFIRGHSK